MGLANHSGQMKKEEKTHKSQGGVHRGKHLPQLIHTSSTKSKQSCEQNQNNSCLGSDFPFFPVSGLGGGGSSVYLLCLTQPQNSL